MRWVRSCTVGVIHRGTVELPVPGVFQAPRGIPVSPDPTIQNELLSYLGQLGSEDQAKVVNLARTLANSPKPGTPGKEWLRIVGAIPHDDLVEMKRFIEEECERIDANEW